MNTIAKQSAKALIEAQGAGRLYSELDGKWVRNGHGMMSQRTLSEMLAKRNAC